MKKLYCDNCGRFIQDEYPGIDYQPTIGLSFLWQSSKSLCSPRCARSLIDAWEEAAAHTALEHYLEVRKRNYGGLLTLTPVQEHLDGIWG